MRRLTAIAIALAFGAAAAPAQAGAQDQRPLEPIAKVAPGVFLAPVGEPGEPAEQPPSDTAAEPRPEKRIVGGADTTIEQWPWQAAIAIHPDQFVVEQDGFQRQICGGSLLTATIIVSAAHCFYDDTLLVGGFTDPAGYTAITGRTVLSSEQGQEIPFANYYAFVDEEGNALYDPDSNVWDVVLVELEQPSSSQPIKLAGPLETDLWAPGKPAVVTGWGTTDPGNPNSASDTLRAASVDMLADATCTGYWGSRYDAETMVCAGVLAGGRDSCQGDSGGPLVVPTPTGEHRLVGDTSFGDGCGVKDTPAVYGRLADDPIRTTLRFAVMELTGLDVVGSPPPPPAPPPPAANPACDRLQERLERLEKKLRKAKRALRRAKPQSAKKQRARQKVKRVRGKTRTTRAKAGAACG